MSDVDIKRGSVVDFSNLRSMALYLKVFDEAEMISLNDPNNILRHCVSTALKIFFSFILTDRIFTARSADRIYFDIRLN